MDWIQAVCTALVVGVIGPAFWLLVAVLENKLTAWGVPIAGVDLGKLQTWASLLRLLKRGRNGQRRPYR